MAEKLVTATSLAARLYRAHPSTWMVFAAWVAAAMVMHVSTVGMLVVAALGPWLFITREIARIEGLGRRVSGLWSMRTMVLAAVGFAAIVTFAAASVRFVGI